MKKKMILVSLFAMCVGCFASSVYAQKTREFYQITVYHFKNAEQESLIDTYLKNGYLPALHRKGINNIGVFKSVANDTAVDKLIYVITPLKSIQQSVTLRDDLLQDKQFLEGGKEYLDASHKNPPYQRMENILLRAFHLAPIMTKPKLTSEKQQRIYELRSYESATEKLHRNKVKMFNEGGEIKLFARLNFNAVFYGEVIAGSKMPNLMYLTTFENKADRDAHWKTFSNDAEWKKLSPQPEYQNNVSKNDIVFLYPTDYSDY